MAQTMFERYGGFAKISKVVGEFYERATESPIIGHYFAGKEMRTLIDHQTKFISSIMGGPASYTDAQLKNAHANLKIDDQAFNEMATVLTETLEDYDFEAADIATVDRGIRDRKHLIVTQ